MITDYHQLPGQHAIIHKDIAPRPYTYMPSAELQEGGACVGLNAEYPTRTVSRLDRKDSESYGHAHPLKEEVRGHDDGQ